MYVNARTGAEITTEGQIENWAAVMCFEPDDETLAGLDKAEVVHYSLKNGSPAFYFVIENYGKDIHEIEAQVRQATKILYDRGDLPEEIEAVKPMLLARAQQLDGKLLMGNAEYYVINVVPNKDGKESFPFTHISKHEKLGGPGPIGTTLYTGSLYGRAAQEAGTLPHKIASNYFVEQMPENIRSGLGIKTSEATGLKGTGEFPPTNRCR
ncbi:MAG: hypothetical protein FWE53_00205 [Firmicutes bacterium]|nr:hypothetical protein [Bacillota bacterium]